MRPLLLVLATACGLGRQSPPPPPPEEWTWTGPAPRHALLIVTDTTRADLLREAHTPHLDALSTQGARVERAWSAGTWTVPSVISLMTGAPVRAHGWDESTGMMGRYPPLPDQPTLPEVLSAAGFSTHGLYANPYLAEDLGFDRGFDTWKRSGDARMPAQLTKHVEAEWGDGGRHFAYVHLIGPHSPLKPSAAAAARWSVEPAYLEEPRGLLIGAAKRDRQGDFRRAYGRAYRAVIEDTDARIGELLAALGPHRADTLVVVTSDHGELLGEHERVGHGRHVWEALTWVPLRADHPGLPGARERLPASASNAAVADLVTRTLRVEHAWPVSITDPLPLVSQREGRVALSPEGRHKALWDRDLGRSPLLFDLSADPDEVNRMDDPPQLARLQAARDAFEAAHPEPTAAPADPVQLDADHLDQLRELGYLGEPAKPTPAPVEPSKP